MVGEFVLAYWCYYTVIYLSIQGIYKVSFRGRFYFYPQNNGGYPHIYRGTTRLCISAASIPMCLTNLFMVVENW